MAAIFCDCDGTLVKWGTNTPLPGAVEELQACVRRGHQLIFTTARPHDSVLIQFLQSQFGGGFQIMFEVQNPRVLINDTMHGGAMCIVHPADTAWKYDLVRRLK